MRSSHRTSELGELGKHGELGELGELGEHGRTLKKHCRIERAKMSAPKLIRSKMSGSTLIGSYKCHTADGYIDGTCPFRSNANCSKCFN